MSGRPARAKPVRLCVVRCSECDACMDLGPLLLARDLAIVSALIQNLGIDPQPSERVKALLDRLAKRSVDLCTSLGFYGDDYLGEEE